VSTDAASARAIFCIIITDQSFIDEAVGRDPPLVIEKKRLHVRNWYYNYIAAANEET
jgi:hypothetical protein